MGRSCSPQATHTIVHDEEAELPEPGFLDLGEQRLKGLDRPVRIYQVTAPGLPARGLPSDPDRRAADPARIPEVPARAP